MTAFGSTITVPLVLSKAFCIYDDQVGLGQIINTVFFVSGISTLLQTTLGIRYVWFVSGDCDSGFLSYITKMPIHAVFQEKLVVIPNIHHYPVTHLPYYPQ